MMFLQITWEITPPDSRTAILEATEEVLELTSLEFDQEGVYKCSVDGYSHLSKVVGIIILLLCRVGIPCFHHVVIKIRQLVFMTGHLPDVYPL
jgi:hypothetical protein